MASLFDKILDEYGLKYEDLNMEERETYNSKVFNVKAISVEDIKEHVTAMKNSIALQLTDVPDDDEHQDKNRKLKARLKNYLVLEAFLNTPVRAEKALREAVGNLKNAVHNQKI